MQRFLRQKCIEIVRKDERLCKKSRKSNKYLDLVRAVIESNIPRRADINPLDLLYVDPNDINVMTKNGFHDLEFLLLSPVLEGDWDKKVQSLDEYDLYNSLLSRFKNEKKWEKTEFYDRVKKEFEENENLTKWGCVNFEEFKARLDLIDRLYKTIKNQGYKTQRQLRKEGRNLFDHNYASVPERNEVEINIGRDGELISADGRHRLTIARCLNISTIPVRVKIRHKEWQNKRIKAKKGLLEESTYLDHPDIQNIK